MAIHATASGKLILGKILAEDPLKWIFQAVDNKHPTVIGKSPHLEPKNRVFDGENAVADAMAWQDSIRQRGGK